MTHNFLFEIGLEEMPAGVILSAENQLEELATKYLAENQLNFEEITSYSTPRRLALSIKGLDEKQSDRTDLVKGPALRIAKGEDGEWSKAAIGFTKGQGVDVDQIQVKEVKGEDYIFVEKFTAGKSAVEIVSSFSDLAEQINFSVSMKWGQSDSKRYIRPVHWLVSLLDNQVVADKLFDVESSNITFGHRFLGSKQTIESADVYESVLENDYVIPNREKRKQLIVDQIEELCSKNNWQSPLHNEDLLAEVTDLVEYPTVFYGSFDESFLEVPEQALETSMADHQRYFSVRDKDTQVFLPHFIGVRNGNADHLDNVIAGNEKVLVARLEDAKFFYDEDKETPIDDFVEKLKSVQYKQELGTLYDKQMRVKHIAKILGQYIGSSSSAMDHMERITSIYKFDLVTAMVNEFSDLQGAIGTVYAKEKGEKTEVAEAIEQQYMPSSVDGEMPYTEEGILLSLAEKFDSTMMFFAIGDIPTGSNDPFALRRSALGIVRILKENNIQLLIREAVNEIISSLNISAELKAGFAAHSEEYFQFIKDRIASQMKLQTQPIPHDIRQAVLTSKDQNIIGLFDKAEFLKEQKEQDNFEFVYDQITRVGNLAKKVEETHDVDESLFESDSEKALYAELAKAKQTFANDASINNQYNALVELAPKVSDFFENNMVNTENSEVKGNREALLTEIFTLSIQFANFHELAV